MYWLMSLSQDIILAVYIDAYKQSYFKALSKHLHFWCQNQTR